MTKLRYIWDEETYPNIYTVTFYREDGKHTTQFEISDRRNDTQGLLKACRYFRDNQIELVGFNSLGFDYPILHKMLLDAGRTLKEEKTLDDFAWSYSGIYRTAQEQINSLKGDRFMSGIKESEHFFPQIDLFKIHHFDNKAKSTSLKLLEFNMRSPNIEDLPFPVGMELNDEQKDVLLKYNLHDVKETAKFYQISKPAINFRVALTEQMQMNVINFNDTKIGKQYFIQKLEEANPGSCYRWERNKRVINQTHRDEIAVADILFDYYDFKQPAFQAILQWFKDQRITETKGVFADLHEHQLGDVAKYANMRVRKEKFAGEFTEDEFNAEIFPEYLKKYPCAWSEVLTLKAQNPKYKGGGYKKAYWAYRNHADTLNVVINGFQFDFGTGGIHGSVPSGVYAEDDEYEIIDADVSSMYPNLAIANRVYPLHLGELFCVIYEDVYNQRKKYAKGTPENGVMKLALNGVYGDSNNAYSPFYDPAYTMAITINGQLSLCLLSERLMTIPDLSIIQVNTDGVTVKIKRKDRELYDNICKQWMKDTGLELEFAFYRKMFIRDVNNYIAVYTNGKVKRKGVYQYEDLGWHQDQSALIIRKAAEAAMLYDAKTETDRLEYLREFVKSHQNEYDFFLRVKINRGSRLVLVYDDHEEPQQNVCRYYPAKSGGTFIKIMPPLKPGKPERRIGLDVEYKVKTCNNVEDFDRLSIDYDYYVNEAQKLIIF